MNLGYNVGYRLNHTSRNNPPGMSGRETNGETIPLKKETVVAEPDAKVLETKLLHHVMVTFNIPSNWPTWTIWLLTIIFGALSALIWLPTPGDGGSWATIAIGQTLFLLGDQAILAALPKKGLSFGPWKGQFFALAVPRLAATIVTGIVGIVAGTQFGMAAFFSIQAFGTAALIWGAVVEPFRLSLTKLEILSDRLPKGTQPIKLLHISDLHVERLTRREGQLMALVEDAAPDLIVITGDYVNLSYNRDQKTHAQVKQLLSRLRAPGGVYATLGSPPVDLRDSVVHIFDGLDIPLMREEWVTVDLGDDRRFVIIGMDCTHHLPTDAARLDRLMDVAPNGVPQLLLYHSPELMPEASAHGIDLYLCGHTHGGQVRLPIVGPLITSSQLGREYVMGHYVNGRTNLYVSRGVGLEGLGAPRVRFLSPPEITLVTLRAAEERNLPSQLS
jgi:predicted MPP superfamily phosphohydrolase